MFVYVSRVYSIVQNNPRPRDDLTDAENVRKTMQIKTFEIMLNIAMFLKCNLAYIGVNCAKCKTGLIKM